MADCKNEIIASISNNNCCSHCFVKTLFFVCAKPYKSGYKISASNNVLLKLNAIIKNFYPELEVQIKGNFAFVYGNMYQLMLDADYLDMNVSNMDDCCRLTMLKTIFLLCGRLSYTEDDSINSKGYILEFSVEDNLVGTLKQLLTYFEFNFGSKTRNHKQILYTKNSAIICDFLAKLGAVECSFDVQNSLVMREIRNTANRQNNCFEHNLNKTIGASALQLEAINYLVAHNMLDMLEDNLKEIALLRLANPDISLNELKTLLGTSISRAGIKYRLDKLIDIYKTQKGDK